MDTELVQAWLRAAAAEVEQQEQRLTELDAAIGDGDHGSNLRRGFRAVRDALDALPPGTPAGAVLAKAGTTLISKVGGAAGPLYGSALRATAAALPTTPNPAPRPTTTGPPAAGSVTAEPTAARPTTTTTTETRPTESATAELAAALRAGLGAVQRLGGAAPGDKTMVDAFEPAVAALELAAERGLGLAEATALAAAAAERGCRETVPLQARKGRASYLGPRSVGHQDPGATSTALLFTALAEAARSAPDN